MPREYGGLGLGPYRGDVFTLWMMTKEVAKADLSLARCWEGHANSLRAARRDGHGRAEAALVRGHRGAGREVGGLERRATVPRTRRADALRHDVERVAGGYVIEGSKAFCTSAGGARWALLLVNTSGPGGARHASSEAAETLLLVACDLDDPSIRFDGSWWDPDRHALDRELRGALRPHLRAGGESVGRPGEYLREGWQTCFVPHYAASFLGAAEAAYEYGLAHIRAQNKGDDPYVQHHVAKMAMNVETAHLWLRHVASLWERGDYDEARIAGSRARHLVEHLALETVDHCVRACGARALNRPSPMERVLRDLSIYVRHDNDDQVLATIGKSVLGRDFDSSFFKP